MNKTKYKTKISFEDVWNEYCERDERNRKGWNLDASINDLFLNVDYETLMDLANYWPKCGECKEPLKLTIEFYDRNEIPKILKGIAESLKPED